MVHFSPSPLFNSLGAINPLFSAKKKKDPEDTRTLLDHLWVEQQDDLFDYFTQRIAEEGIERIEEDLRTAEQFEELKKLGRTDTEIN